MGRERSVRPTRRYCAFVENGSAELECADPGWWRSNGSRSGKRQERRGRQCRRTPSSAAVAGRRGARPGPPPRLRRNLSSDPSLFVSIQTFANIVCLYVGLGISKIFNQHFVNNTKTNHFLSLTCENQQTTNIHMQFLQYVRKREKSAHRSDHVVMVVMTWLVCVPVESGGAAQKNRNIPEQETRTPKRTDCCHQPAARICRFLSLVLALWPCF